MAFWWVNHKQTRAHEVRGGYLWSPFRNSNGAFNQTYENMRHAQIGDVVFSYADGHLGAIGRVTAGATPSPKPTEFGRVGDYWSGEGWLVEVEFVELPKPMRPRDRIAAIGPLLPIVHSPIRQNGDGNQGVYLAGITDALGLMLVEMLDARPVVQAWANHVRESAPAPEVLEDLHEIEGTLSIPETQRLQLAKARIGQGLFRKRVILLEGACRVTGVTDTRLLVASHIKPWRGASNSERLDGHNGLLLSPHVDALFDGKLLTFEDDGRVHVHASVPRDVLERWSIDPTCSVGAFRREQTQYLADHRRQFAVHVA